MSRTTRAYLGLGSNLGDREAMLLAARARLAALPQAGHCRASPVYETDPVGFTEQAPFLNAALEVEWSAGPEELLAAALAVEAELGRVRAIRWGPRTIDIDILLFGEETRSAADLTIPHPRLVERAFALVPLADLAPEHPIPGTGLTVAAALARLPAADRGGVRRYAPRPAPPGG